MTPLRHVTPGKKIKALLEQREERGATPANLTQLAKAAGMSREELSRRANDHIGVTPEFAERIAPHLEVSAAELLPPSVERVSLTILAARLEEREVEIDRITTTLELLAARVVRIEERLDDLGAPGQTVHGGRGP